MKTLEITKIPQLNSVVLKQKGGHFFIAAPNSFVIDKDGLMLILWELIKVGFLAEKDTELLQDLCKGWYEEKGKVDEN